MIKIDNLAWQFLKLQFEFKANWKDNAKLCFFLLHIWDTLCKIALKALTTEVFQREEDWVGASLTGLFFRNLATNTNPTYSLSNTEASIVSDRKWKKVEPQNTQNWWEAIDKPDRYLICQTRQWEGFNLRGATFNKALNICCGI